MNNQDSASPARTVLLLMLCIAAWPIAFLSVLLIWRAVDRFEGQREVLEFVEAHQAIVAERLKDPRVYSFRIAPDPEDDSRLLIEWEVADRDTYLMLDKDVGDWVQLSQPPTMRCNLRSNEGLPNDFGAMAYGIGQLGETMFRVKMAVAIATLVVLISLAGYGATNWLRKNQPHNTAAEHFPVDEA
ncbi:hypothetical protein [Aeoliella sp.]|uniref:hypothetical protein n=1 Tax=Aeoliella sp. TaxID=2795800 RepID=UPI003CCC0924